MTASTVQDQIQTFASTLLERRGALVEWPPGRPAGTAVLPPEVTASLGAGANVLPLGPEVAAQGLSTNLAGDFLQWTGRLLEAEPRVGVFRTPGLYLKRKQIEEGVARAFTWLNVKVGIGCVRETTIEYHTWWFHGVLSSDDGWETRFSLSLNAASGAEVSNPDLLELWELQPQDAPPRAPPTYPRAKPWRGGS